MVVTVKVVNLEKWNNMKRIEWIKTSSHLQWWPGPEASKTTWNVQHFHLHVCFQIQYLCSESLHIWNFRKWEAFCYFWINGSRWPAALSLQLSESHNQSDGVMQLKDALLRVNRTLSHFLRTTFWSPVKRHSALSTQHRQTINWPSTLADLVSVFGENIFVSSLAAIGDFKVSLLV